MKTKRFISTIIALSFGILCVTAQPYQQYPAEIVRTTKYYNSALSFVYYEKQTLSPFGWESYAGREDRLTDDASRRWESLRMSYKWDISNIPDVATIDTVIFEIWCDTRSDGSSLDSVRVRIRSMSSSLWSSFADTGRWNGMARTTQYAYSGMPKSFDNIIIQRTFVAGSQVCTDVKNGLSSNAFYLSVIGDADETWGTGQGSYHRASIYQGNQNQGDGIRLTIKYRTTSNITVKNSFAGGSLKVDDTLHTNVPSEGLHMTWNNGTTHTLDAIDDQDIGGSNWKYNDWKDKYENVLSSDPQLRASVQATGDNIYSARFTERTLVTGTFVIASGDSVVFGPGGGAVFGSGARILVYGKLTANGSPSSHVVFDGRGYPRSSMIYPMIVVASGGSVNLQYADLKNAAYDLTLWYNSGAVAVQNCTFTNFGYSADSKAITLNAPTGTVTISNNTITGSNSQGTGIYSNSTGTNVTIASNTITSAGTGIYCYSSDAFLTSNVIRSCVNYGIQADYVTSSARYQGNDIRSCAYGLSLNSSSPYIWSSIIIQNNLNVLVNSSSPNFMDPGDDQLRGHNTIAHAASPLLRAQNYSYVYLGYGYQGGYNSIFDCDLPHLWVSSYSGVSADNNYWGEEGPSAYYDGTSWALMESPLWSNPNPDPLGKRGYDVNNSRTVLGKKASSSTSSDVEKQFHDAVGAGRGGEIETAKQGFRSIIDQNPDSKFAPPALLAYYDFSRMQQAISTKASLSGEPFDFLSTFLGPSGGSPLRPFAVRLLAREAVLSNSPSIALGYYDDLIANYANSMHEVAALYNEIVYYINVEQNSDKAKMLLTRMKEAYPKDPLTAMARVLVGEKFTLTEFVGENQKGVATDDIPTEAGLFAPYPNPFNPSTTLSFQVAEAGFVSLRVYDLLGREVALLISEEKQPGTYTVRFDASSLPTGVYFSKLETVGKSFTRKMLLLK